MFTHEKGDETTGKGVETELKKFAEKPSKLFTYAEYLQYCKYVIVRIIVYNLRRSGEVAAMSLKQFDERTKGKEEWLCLRVKQREMACYLACSLFLANMEELPTADMTEEEKTLAASISNISLHGKGLGG